MSLEVDLTRDWERGCYMNMTITIIIARNQAILLGNWYNIGAFFCHNALFMFIIKSHLWLSGLFYNWLYEVYNKSKHALAEPVNFKNKTNKTALKAGIGTSLFLTSALMVKSFDITVVFMEDFISLYSSIL